SFFLFFFLGKKNHFDTILKLYYLFFFNILAKKIKATLLNGQTKKIKIENKGIYFIQVRTGNLVKHQKLLIQ
ncbi:MAG: T9SS type A sorting domain-containing protein, partial [Bacteroidales bacterium]